MTDFNEPQSLTEEAEAQGIEIMESSTTQVEVDPDIGDPFFRTKSRGKNIMKNKLMELKATLMMWLFMIEMKIKRIFKKK